LRSCTRSRPVQRRARQYLQVAEEFLRLENSNSRPNLPEKSSKWTRENVAMRVRLAEVYIRLGKKTDRLADLLRSAESCALRGSRSGAEEILQRMPRSILATATRFCCGAVARSSLGAAAAIRSSENPRISRTTRWIAQPC